MRWVEEIRVRTQPRKEEEVMDVLTDVAASLAPNDWLREARVYSHQSAPATFSLILTWDTASVPLRGSDQALLILDGLKRLGLLDHTVLVERGMKKRQRRTRAERRPTYDNGPTENHGKPKGDAR
jgi:hypothetical protein